MASDKNDFEERLKRIHNRKGINAQTTERNAGGGSGIDLGPKKSKMPLIALSIFGGLACLMLVAFVLLQVTEGTALPREMANEVAATIQDKDVQPKKQHGLVDLVKAWTGVGEKSNPPEDFLPPAPEGWIRVTATDAAQSNPLKAVEERWPENPAGASFPLEQNLGYNRMRHFIDLRAKPDVEQKVLSKKRTMAIYLGANGEFLLVRLEFLSSMRALGNKTSESAWIETLRELEIKELKSGEELEVNQLAGMPITNRTEPRGKSLVNRPIGTDYDAPNGLKIAVPLSHRSVMHIVGLSTPRTAETLLASTDLKALRARHN